MKINISDKNSNTDVRTLIGASAFYRYGLETKSGRYAYFILSPVNISVMSRDAARQRIDSLMHVIVSRPDLSVICLDSCENYDSNRYALERRMTEESNPKIRRLIEADAKHLGRMAADLSISRQFVIAVKLDTDTDTQALQAVNGTEKLITDEGFAVRRADRNDIMRMLSCYFSTRPDARIPDGTDGESAVAAWLEENI